MTRLWLAVVVLLAACDARPELDAGVEDAGPTHTDAGVDGGLDAGVDAGPPDPRWVLPPAGLTAAELGVLVNLNDPLSVAVANRYVQTRGIPPDHRIELSFPVTPVMSVADFTAAKALVDARLDGGIQALALTWTSPYRVDCMSVTTAFAIGYDAGAFCSTPCAPTSAVPTFDARSHRLRDDFGILPTMMLAAVDAGEAFALIDRGLASDGTLPGGEGFLVRTSDTARSVRWPDFVSTVNAFISDGGLSLHYVDDAGTVDGQAGVLFYFTGLADVPGIATNTYRPGAVADHLTSYGGQVPQSGQMSALRWLEAGATASYGTVVEPCNYTTKFPQVSVLLLHYFRGEPIIEAYWKSVRMPGEGLFIGEPLARPFDRDVTAYDRAAQTLSLTTNRLEPRRWYDVEAADSPNGPWTVVQPGLSLLSPRRVTLTVWPATAAYYRLVP